MGIQRNFGHVEAWLLNAFLSRITVNVTSNFAEVDAFE